MQVQTVKIVAPLSEDNPLGYIVINESDFDPDNHEIFEEDIAVEIDPKKMAKRKK